MKKNIILAISLFLTMTIFTSCDTDLNLTNPNKKTSETFWKTETDFEQAIITCYTPLKRWNGGYYGTRGLMVRISRSDEFAFRSDLDDIYKLHMFTNTTNNSVVSSVFAYLYQGIYRANLIEEKLNEAELSAEFKNKIKGEAMFFRGLYYFILAKEFGDVPIRLQASQQVSTFPIAKSPQSEVYLQAAKDFQTAADLLPIESQKGKPTKGAALAFLGKLNVYMGQWAKAKAILEPLTKSPYSYGLVDDYSWNFDEAHAFNKESIFEIIFDGSGGTDSWDDGESPNTSQGTSIAVEYASSKVGGWYMANPTSAIMNIFLSEKTASGDIDKRTKLSVAWDYPGCMYYQKPIQEILSANELKSYWLIKGSNSATRTQEVETEPSRINERIMRYADVLLLLAECELEQGSVETAVNYIDKVRMRGGNLPAYSGNKNKASVKAELIKQRAIEFFREGERFYDLRRWGLLESALQKADPIRASYFNKERSLYLPVPEKEIQTNPDIKQSTGW